EVQRKVERRDRGDGADREAPDRAEGAFAPRLDVHGDDLAREARRLFGCQPNGREPALDFGGRVPDGLPRLADDGRDEPSSPRSVRGSPAKEESGPGTSAAPDRRPRKTPWAPRRERFERLRDPGSE